MLPFVRLENEQQKWPPLLRRVLRHLHPLYHPLRRMRAAMPRHRRQKKSPRSRQLAPHLRHRPLYTEKP